MPEKALEEMLVQLKRAERRQVKGGALTVPPAVSFSINFFLCALSAIIV